MPILAVLIAEATSNVLVSAEKSKTLPFILTSSLPGVTSRLRSKIAVVDAVAVTPV